MAFKEKCLSNFLQAVVIWQGCLKRVSSKYLDKIDGVVTSVNTAFTRPI